jgi:uncharacterized protein (DUF849 family)
MAAMFVKACINGARRRTDHAGVPQTAAELAEAAAGAVGAGAAAIHMHPRAADGTESLDGSAISAAVAAVRGRVGVPVGVSTGAWFLPDPDDRLRAVATWTDLPDFASVNVHEPGALDLAEALLERGVGVEAGLWHAEGARLCVESGLAERCTRLLVEPLVPDLDDALALVAAIDREIEGAALAVPRLLHGFGGTAWPVLDLALARGLQARIGLEDTLVRRDGTAAPDNATLVADALAST